MNSEAVLYQSVMQNNSPFQQLSNLVLSGFVTIANQLNTDAGKLYGSLTYSASTYTLNWYKDISQTNLVMSGTATGTLPQTITLTAQNNSLLSGTVVLQQYYANDTLLVAQCFLSVDDPDLQMTNLTSLNDYDPTYGFAAFHLKAFDNIKEIVKSRYRSILWNRALLDSNSVNGGIGGYDLSRVQSWSPLREASAYYTLHLILNRQNITEGSVFARRSKDALEKFTLHMDEKELAFDTRLQRIADKTRALRTFKISRA